MSITDLKIQLHQQIDSLQKEDDLQELMEIIAAFLDQRNTSMDETAAQLMELRKRVSNLPNTRLTTHSEVIKEVKQWLTK